MVLVLQPAYGVTAEKRSVCWRFSDSDPPIFDVFDEGKRRDWTAAARPPSTPLPAAVRGGFVDFNVGLHRRFGKKTDRVGSENSSGDPRSPVSWVIHRGFLLARHTAGVLS